MQPVNRTERTRAFINFLLLFIVCIAIIVTTVFFSTQVPLKQADDLLKKMYVVRQEQKFSDELFTKALSIQKNLDSINTMPLLRADLLDREITDGLGDINKMINTDSGYNKNIYSLLVSVLYDLQAAQKQLRQSSSQLNNTNDLNSKISSLSAELSTEKTNNAILQSALTQCQSK